ncbi:uncharacterized protein LOC134805213 [Cydia splendana]|uniref:uncharacterized protein LOC134805213 n=1 Tax=Cydia splendana TaxID=1100963 RepID=UPI00300D4439
MATPRSPVAAQANTHRNNTNYDAQCSGCKVIINELLTFLSNKVDVLPETAISEICLTAYTSEEIEESRCIALKLLAPQKKFMRRKEGSEQKSIHDMVKMIKEFEPDSLPIFVARDLNKIPPVSFNYIDSTSFLKEIAILRSDVAAIKAEKNTKSGGSCSSSEIEGLKSEVEEVKSIVKALKKKDSCACECKQQKTAQQNASQSFAAVTQKRGTSKQLTGQLPPAPGTIRKQSAPHSLSQNNNSPITNQLPDAVQMHVPLYKDIINTTSSLEAHERFSSQRDIMNDSFITVERKKRKKIYSNLTGTAQGSSKLQLADLTSFVYVSRLNKSTTVDNIMDYVKDKGEECFKIDLLTQRHDTDFCSFKLSVPRRKLDTFLSKEFWPEGVKFRLFRERTARGTKPLNP